MRLKFYSYLLFFLVSFLKLSAQQSSEYRVIQTTSNDTLYLDFEIRRTSAIPYDILGYNLFFQIDPAILDTANYSVNNPGFFGNLPNRYLLPSLKQIEPEVYRLSLVRRTNTSNTTELDNDFVKAGKVAFIIKGCGTSTIRFNIPDHSSVILGIFNNFDFESQPPPFSALSLNVSGKSNLVLTANKDTVCRGGNVTFTAESRPGNNQFSLFSQSATGIHALIRGPQASNVFDNISINSSASYFVTFLNGSSTACRDTTNIVELVTAEPPFPLTINPVSPPICLGSRITITSTTNNLSNSIGWRLNPTTLARFTGATSGVGLNTVNIEFPGTSPYTVQLIVQDTNKYGCVSAPTSIPLTVTRCDLKADFSVNGSESELTTCQGAQVVFQDRSTSLISNIVKWSWNFGAGSVPDTSNLKSPPAVKYSSSGLVNVSLTVTDNNGLSRTITKTPTLRVMSVLSGMPVPSCASSSCNEVNFSWPSVPEASHYEVRFKKGIRGAFSTYQTINLVTNFKVTSETAGMGGTLEFSDTRNDTVYFQVKAVAGNCDVKESAIVFCRPSFCSVSPGCNLPAISVPTPQIACMGTNVRLSVNTDPATFYNQAPFESVRFVWENGTFDTSHAYTVRITEPEIQKVKLLTIDTLMPNCYSLNSISIPVGKTLTTKPDLGIQSLQCDRVTFAWKKVEGALKYQIKYTASCQPGLDTNFRDAPLNGQAEFFELTGLSNNCNVNFQVKAIGSCNTTQSDTLISPPTCSCFIGHIASSNVKSCALDTVVFSISNIQVPNWRITWFDPVRNLNVSSSTDTTFRFVPMQANSIYQIKYTIYDLSKADSCKTSGFITDTTGSSVSPEWNPVKLSYCISDAIYYLNDKSVNQGFSFSGTGIENVNDAFYFSAQKAGLGSHTITYNACGQKENHVLSVVDKPCVTTVVGGGKLITNPNDLYTTCDGTIYITDQNAIWKYSPNNVNGIPELIVRSPSNGDIDGNISAALFGKPYGIAMDESTNNELYFADYDRHKIRRIVFDKSRIETIAGQNVVGNNPNNANPRVPLSSARFFNPFGLAIHPNSDTLYVSDLTTNSIKSFTFKDANPQIKLVLGNQAGISLPGRGRNVNVRPRRIAVDSLGLSFTDEDGFIGRYQFFNDSANASSSLTVRDFKDGFPSQYRLRSVSGVTPRIGDWIFFTDKDNYALRRINAVTGYMETVAGSPPQNGPPSNFPTLADGPAFSARFSVPTALSFNIKGYIDVLDAGSPAAVRRYYIPGWGTGTWDHFDSTYVVNCDSDTLTPAYSAGTLRVIKGNANDLKGNIFRPTATGEYLLGYKIKVGRCDTTFFKTVRVKPQPLPVLSNITACNPSVILTAVSTRDTSLRYKWFGPDSRAVALNAHDTSRSINVTQAGKYWVEIYFGKARKCVLIDSSVVDIIQGQSGTISTIPASNADSAIVCFGETVTLSMNEISSTAPKFRRFLWSTGDTTRTIAASGSAIFIATAKDSLGCDVTARFKVVQPPLPGVCIKATDNATGRNLGWGTYTVSTIAGKSGVSGSENGTGNESTFFSPSGLTIFNDTLFVSDQNNLVRSVSLRNNNVANYLGIAGTNIITDSVSRLGAVFNSPQGLQFDKAGNLYVVNSGANNITRYDRTKNLYRIFAGSGIGTHFDSIGKFASLFQPANLVINSAGSLIFTDYQSHTIRTIDYRQKVRTLAGSRMVSGQSDGKGLSTSFNLPFGIAVDPSGNLIIAEEGNQTLRKISLDTTVRLAAGSFLTPGSANSNHWSPVSGIEARFNRPGSMSSDDAGNIFFTDAGNNLVRVLDKNGNIITIAGRSGVIGSIDGHADSATFSNISGIVVDGKTNNLYIADKGNHTIRKLSRNKTVYVCKDSPYSITDSCTTANGDLDVTWKRKSPAGTFVNLLQPPIQRTDTGTYVMEARYRNGCNNVISDTITVRYHERDSTFRITEPVDPFTQACFGQVITLAATPGYSEYQWFIQSGSTELPLLTSVDYSKRISIDTVGIFKLVVYARNKSTGCLDRLRGGFEKSLYITPRLKAEFSDTLTCLGNTTSFKPLESDTTLSTYKWDFGVTTIVSDTATTATANFEYPYLGTYKVRLIVSDPFQNSCPDTITKPVIINGLPRLTLSIAGNAGDTARFCDAGSVNLNLRANFVRDANTVGPITYHWFETGPGGGNIGTSTLATNTASPLLPPGILSAKYGYGVYVKDQTACASNKDTVFARLSKSPKFGISASNYRICLGQSLTLTPFDSVLASAQSGIYSYKWYRSGRLINPDSTDPILTVSPLVSGTYTLIVKNISTGCFTTIVSPLIEVTGFRLRVNPVPPPLPCTATDSVSITAELRSGSAISPYEVLWTDSLTGGQVPALFNETRLKVKIFRDSTRVLKLYMRDAAGCYDSLFVKVQGTSIKMPRFSLDITPSAKICRGQSVTLTPFDSSEIVSKPENYTYAWDSSGVPLRNDINNPVLIKSPDFNVQYSLTVKDRNSGCSTKVNAAPIEVTGFDLKIRPVIAPQPCSASDSVELLSEIEGIAVEPLQKILWTDSAGRTTRSLNSTTLLNVKSFRDSTRIYKLFVQDAQGCFDSAYVKVQGTSLKAPAFSILPLQKTKICRGEEITLIPRDSANSEGTAYEYLWDSLGVLVNEDVNNPQLTKRPLNSVTYNLRVKSKNSGCIQSVPGQRIDVSGFTIGVDPVSAPRNCSATDSISLTAKVVNGNALPPYTIQWTDSTTGALSASLYNPSNMVVKVFRDSTRVFKVKLKDDAGCTDSSYVTVNGTSRQVPAFVINTSEAGPICRGQEITFTPQDQKNNPPRLFDYTFAWDSAGKLISSNPILTRSPSKTVQFNLKITSRHSGCDTVLKTPQIVVNGFDVQLKLNTPLILCAPADSAQISAVVTASSISMIQWTDSSTAMMSSSLYNPEKLNVKVYRDLTRVYKLTVTDETGCEQAGFIKVKANPQTPPAFAVINGRDTGVCVNGQTRIRLVVGSGEPPFTFTWTDSLGNLATEINQTDPFNPLISAVSGVNAKKYYVTMKDADGCFTVRDSVKVTLYDMNISIAGTTNKLCRTSSDPAPLTDYIVNIQNINSTGSVVIPTWKNLTTGQIVNVGRELGPITAAGNYQVEVINETTSCLRRANVSISLLNAPENSVLNINGNPSGCNNELLNLVAAYPSGNLNTMRDSVQYTWSVFNGLNSITSNDSLATYQPLPADTNVIMFKVHMANRCGVDSNSVNSVKLIPAPFAKLLSSVLETRTNKEVIFTNATTNSDSINQLIVTNNSGIVWGAGSGQTFTHIYSREGQYKATLISVNKNGCSSSDSLVVIALDKQNLFIPNVFSPSASQQENQTFKIFGQNLSPEGFTLVIYDRWGHLVFITTDLNKAMFVGWDGKEGAADSQMGVYTYAIRGQFNDGEVFEKTGTVTLIR